MDHQITILTLGSRAPVQSSGGANVKNTPFAGSSTSQPLKLNMVEVQTMLVSDDDAALDGIFASKSYDGGTDADQVLADDITLMLGNTGGTQTISEGTQIGFDFSGWLFIREGNVANGKVIAAYEIAFPRTVGSGSMGEISGGQYSIMVIPTTYTYTNSSGTHVVDPVPFDPDQTYFFGGTKAYNRDDHAIDYYQVDCFATGSLIDTLEGPRAVETLKAGDLVMTRDDGAQALRWAGHVHVDADRLDLQPNLRPIRINAGALGPDRPRRDLVLSPQHRVLVRSTVAERMFGTREILVAAKHLLSLPGIEVVDPPEGVGYHHLLFDRHQIVRSEGAWTESLYPGPQAMKGMTPAGRREVLSLFPELSDAGFQPKSARRLVNGREGRKLAERHGKNRKQLVEPIISSGKAQNCHLPA